MEIQINYEYREQDVADLFDMRRLIALILNEEKVPQMCEVALTFVDEDTIHQLNAHYRGVDSPTDVLSFECDGYVDDYEIEWGENRDSGVEENSILPFNEGEREDVLPFELGDVIISVDRAQSQAGHYGLSFAEELSLLITHGILHLCGYDHMEDGEAEVMEARETELLSHFWGAPFKRSRVE